MNISTQEFKKDHIFKNNIIPECEKSKEWKQTEKDAKGRYKKTKILALNDGVSWGKEWVKQGENWKEGPKEGKKKTQIERYFGKRGNSYHSSQVMLGGAFLFSSVCVWWMKTDGWETAVGGGVWKRKGKWQAVQERAVELIFSCFILGGGVGESAKLGE